MRPIAYTLTLTITLLLAAPIAAAVYEEGQDECPPDQMWATSTPDEGAEDEMDQPVDNSTDDGDIQYSHNDAEPIPYGEAPYASGPATEEDHVQPPKGAEVGITSDEDGAATVPGFAGFAAIGALAALALIGAFLRRE